MQFDFFIKILYHGKKISFSARIEISDTSLHIAFENASDRERVCNELFGVFSQRPVIKTHLDEICELAVRASDVDSFPGSDAPVIKTLATHLCRYYDVRNSRNSNKPILPLSLEKKLYKVAQALKERERDEEMERQRTLRENTVKANWRR